MQFLRVSLAAPIKNKVVSQMAKFPHHIAGIARCNVENFNYFPSLIMLNAPCKTIETIDVDGRRFRLNRGSVFLFRPIVTTAFKNRNRAGSKKHITVLAPCSPIQLASQNCVLTLRWVLISVIACSRLAW